VTGGALARIRARGTLIVSVKNDAKRPHRDPAHFEKRGFEVAISQALARHIVGDPTHLVLKTLPRPARLPMLAAGAVDLVVSMIPMTPENLAQCDFSHPYFASGLSLLLPARAASLRLADLAGRAVAFRKQSFNAYGAELQRIAGEHGLTIEVRYFQSLDLAAQALARGEVIAVGGNFVDLDAYRRGHDGFTVNDTLLEQLNVGVAVKKGEPELLRLVNETIDALRASGELEKLAAEWKLPYLLPTK
jgi:putative glutamine transport system substrate-binding protein